MQPHNLFEDFAWVFRAGFLGKHGGQSSLENKPSDISGSSFLEFVSDQKTWFERFLLPDRKTEVSGLRISSNFQNHVDGLSILLPISIIVYFPAECWVSKFDSLTHHLVSTKMSPLLSDGLSLLYQTSIVDWHSGLRLKVD